MDVDILVICLAVHELGYDGYRKFREGPGCVRQSSDWVGKVFVLLAFASNF